LCVAVALPSYRETTVVGHGLGIAAAAEARFFDGPWRGVRPRPTRRGERLPTASYVRAMVDAGCLMSCGPNFGDVMRRAASYIDRILEGARPAALPVEQPTKFDLTVNLTTAKALGLTIPQSVLLRADEVVP
jgi:hypothetical protein